MNKLFLFLALSFFLFSCNNDDLVVPEAKSSSSSAIRLNSGENVKLYSAWSSYSSKYGYTTYTKKFKVEVRDLAYDKQVEVFHKMTDGSWKFFPLEYNLSTSEGTEIWQTEIKLNSWETNVSFAKEFAVRYKVNGAEYWDNNFGNDYSLEALNGRFLRNGINLSLHYSAVYPSYDSSGEKTFYLDVDVRNLSPTKDVEVIYTTDNWNSTQVAPLIYQKYLTVGAVQMLISPNSFGMEKWTAYVKIPESTEKVDFAVVCKANGQEYWDNNFGKNYTAK
ncbi:MAG: hypothetical protein H6604_03850 [Flavobacteriales bacterium]|nr:hypothetical protein [Flavobacteriales bacterium]